MEFYMFSGPLTKIEINEEYDRLTLTIEHNKFVYKYSEFKRHLTNIINILEKYSDGRKKPS